MTTQPQPTLPTNREWVVLKYGGTSVSTLETWKAIAARAKEVVNIDHASVFITVSAITQVTNKLIAALEEEGPKQAYEWIVQRHGELKQALGLTAEEMQPVDALLNELRRMLEGVALTGEATPKLRARVLASGELCSSQMGVAYLRRELGNEAVVARVDARKFLIASERGTEHDEMRYLEADVIPRNAKMEIESALETDYPANSRPRVVITQGFIASTSQGATCVLGRGGSDTSGALFAALLQAKRCEIWTDVYGCFTCDPRLVPEARLIREMSYREAQELAAMGAKVLHPRCLGPAQWAGVPVEVRNTMDPAGSSRGILTRVCAHPEEQPGSNLRPRVVAVTKRTGQVLLTVQNFDMWGATGFLSRVFAPFANMGIAVDLIATSEYSVSMTLEHVPGGFRGPVLAKLVHELKQIVPRGSVTVEDKIAIVSIVGRRLRTALPSLSNALKCTRGYDVRMLTESAEDLNLSFVVSDPGVVPGYIDALVLKLHRALFIRDNDDMAGEDGFEEALGATWDELRAGSGPTPKPSIGLPTSTTSPKFSGGGGRTPAVHKSRVGGSGGGSGNGRSIAGGLVMSNGGVLVGAFNTPAGLADIARSYKMVMMDTGCIGGEHLLAVDMALLTAALNSYSPVGAGEPARIFSIADFNGLHLPISLLRIVAKSPAINGLLCETLAQVRHCFPLITGGTRIVYAPRHIAPEDEYAQALAMGCNDLVADDGIALDMLLVSESCAGARIFAAGDDAEGKWTWRCVRDGSGGDTFLNRAMVSPVATISTPAASTTTTTTTKALVVVAAEVYTGSIAMVTSVARVVGTHVQVTGPLTIDRVEELGLKVINASRGGELSSNGGGFKYGARNELGKVEVGDVLVAYFPDRSGMKSAGKWWGMG